MLSVAQKQTFRETGLLFLPGLIDLDLVTKLRVLIWRHFESHLICRDDRETWPRGTVSKLRAVGERQSVQDLCDDAVRAVVAELMEGRSLTGFNDHPVQLLITFPDADDWQVPAKMWHLDIPRLATDFRVPGVQAFFFLDDVVPAGGGTVVASGSHHLLNETGKRIHSADVKHELAARYDWFARLLDKKEVNRQQFLEPVHVTEEVAVQVVELTGNAGDVVFMDMRALHAPSPNASGQPRLMATARLIDQDLMAEIYAG